MERSRRSRVSWGVSWAGLMLLVAALPACVSPDRLTLAREAYRTRLDALESRESTDPLVLAYALLRAGEVEENFGQLEAAWPLLERAAELRRRRADAEPKLAAEALERCGRNALARDSLPIALQRYQEAAALLDGAGLGGDPLRVMLQRELALTHELLGDVAKAAEHRHGLADADVVELFTFPALDPPRVPSREMRAFIAMEITVSKVGRVKEVRVVEAQPAGIFDGTINAVFKRRYLPRIVAGEPVVAMARSELAFTLGR